MRLPGRHAARGGICSVPYVGPLRRRFALTVHAGYNIYYLHRQYSCCNQLYPQCTTSHASNIRDCVPRGHGTFRQYPVLVLRPPICQAGARQVPLSPTRLRRRQLPTTIGRVVGTRGHLARIRRTPPRGATLPRNANTRQVKESKIIIIHVLQL